MVKHSKRYPINFQVSEFHLLRPNHIEKTIRATDSTLLWRKWKRFCAWRISTLEVSAQMDWMCEEIRVQKWLSHRLNWRDSSLWQD